MRYLCILIFLFSCQARHSDRNTPLGDSFLNKGETQSSVKNDLNIKIPSAVVDYLSKNLPDWKIPDTSNYINGWRSFYQKEQLPYFVSVDFNGDSKPDYGIIMTNSKSMGLVFLVASEKSFNHWMADDFKKDIESPIDNIEFGLFIQQPGKIEGLDESLDLRNQGIILSKFETSSRVYYWENGKIKVFWTGD